MPLRNSEHGYGGVTKALHWLTVSAILGQFRLVLGVGVIDDSDVEALHDPYRLENPSGCPIAARRSDPTLPRRESRFFPEAEGTGESVNLPAAACPRLIVSA